MDREERTSLIHKYVTAFKCRELSPEWYVCFSPAGEKASILHICKPGTWERLRKDDEGEPYAIVLERGVSFTPFREHRCQRCEKPMPTWAVTLGRLFILGDKI